MRFSPRGKQNNVPVIVGSTADEGTTLFAARMVPKTKEAYVAATRAKYGELADEYLALYPAATDEDGTRRRFWPACATNGSPGKCAPGRD